MMQSNANADKKLWDKGSSIKRQKEIIACARRVRERGGCTASIVQNAKEITKEESEKEKEKKQMIIQ